MSLPIGTGGRVRILRMDRNGVRPNGEEPLIYADWVEPLFAIGECWSQFPLGLEVGCESYVGTETEFGPTERGTADLR